MDALDRLYRRLVEAREHASAGEPLGAISLGEIYQQLVPYRLVRSELGYAELREYEHALLRLLSGERGYVTLEAEEAAEEFRRELGSPNPILGVYRDYAAIGAVLHPFAPREVTDPLPAPPARLPPPPPDPVTAAPLTPSAAPAHLARPESCRHCRAALPRERSARFCPHCGGSQLPMPCVGCGAVLEPDWRFCIECGFRSGESGIPRPPPAPSTRLSEPR
jgi:RNA polymerase subunit RPABC4/transcription elongation factor Spt4